MRTYENISIKTDGVLNIPLKAVEAGGNTPIDLDWHAVENLTANISTPTISGAKKATVAIDSDHHNKLNVSGYYEGENRLVVCGVLGANPFALTYIITATETGTASVTADAVVLETLCVPEDGGVVTFGGEAGAITLSDDFAMDGKKLTLASETLGDLVIDLSDEEDVTSLETAITWLNAKLLSDVFGEDADIEPINAAFNRGKDLLIIAAGVGYVFNRLTATYGDGDTNVFIHTDAEMNTNTITISALGFVAA